MAVQAACTSVHSWIQLFFISEQSSCYLRVVFTSFIFITNFWNCAAYTRHVAPRPCRLTKGAALCWQSWNLHFLHSRPCGEYCTTHTLQMMTRSSTIETGNEFASSSPIF